MSRFFLWNSSHSAKERQVPPFFFRHPVWTGFFTRNFLSLSHPAEKTWGLQHPLRSGFCVMTGPLSGHHRFGPSRSLQILGQVLSEKQSSLLCEVAFCSGKGCWISWPGKIMKMEAGIVACSGASLLGHFLERRVQRTPGQASDQGWTLLFVQLLYNHLQTYFSDVGHCQDTWTSHWP